jgi:hypothetical protein
LVPDRRVAAALAGVLALHLALLAALSGHCAR